MGSKLASLTVVRVFCKISSWSKIGGHNIGSWFWFCLHPTGYVKFELTFSVWPLTLSTINSYMHCLMPCEWFYRRLFVYCVFYPFDQPWSLIVLMLACYSVIPSRRFYPGAYRLYMELLKRHAFSFVSQINCPNYEK